jgi:hypothetical protein
MVKKNVGAEQQMERVDEPVGHDLGHQNERANEHVGHGARQEAHEQLERMGSPNLTAALMGDDSW